VSTGETDPTPRSATLAAGGERRRSHIERVFHGRLRAVNDLLLRVGSRFAVEARRARRPFSLRPVYSVEIGLKALPYIMP
ncbi:hypothetical protein SPRG_18975, partial [Saprolegnia parasitica CBS 223.65]